MAICRYPPHQGVIKSGGEWISSLEIEDIIMKAPRVKEAAAIRVKDENGANAVALVVAH